MDFIVENPEKKVDNFVEFMEKHFDEVQKLSKEYAEEFPEPPTFIEWLEMKANKEE